MSTPAERAGAVRWGLLISSLAVVAGFVANRNIYNSDNYRYLVLLLVPWAIGFGRLMDGLSRRGQGGAIAAAAIGIGFAVAFTLDAASLVSPARLARRRRSAHRESRR